MPFAQVAHTRSAVSQRGVVFFRAQDDLTNDLQKKLMLRLGELTGRPKTSGLHIHPLLNENLELGGDDPEISTISSKQFNKFRIASNKGNSDEQMSPKKQNNAQWHSDIGFEPVPADYTSLRLVQLPETGGGECPPFSPMYESTLWITRWLIVKSGLDTMWASGYEVYDRISEPYQKFLEGLTATFKGDNFKKTAADNGLSLYTKARGAPENVGDHLRAVHPVVRTNPVTGWKSIFPVGGFARHVNGLTQAESDHLLKWFLDLVYQNHDLQVRLKWQNPNDIGKSRIYRSHLGFVGLLTHQ